MGTPSWRCKRSSFYFIISCSCFLISCFYFLISCSDFLISCPYFIISCSYFLISSVLILFPDLLTFFSSDKIQQYFGDTIAMYFAFLGFYTWFLVPPALVGLLAFLFTTPFLVPLICVFNMVWTTVFLEAWKRSAAGHAYNFGTIKSEPFEEARPAYYGTLGINPVTGR